MRIYILAGKHSQAVNWARDHDLKPAQWSYVGSPEVLMGLENPIMIKTGTWGQRDDAQKIIEIYETRQRRLKP